MSGGPVRVGLAGCGRSAARHAASLADLAAADEARLEAVWSPSPEDSARFAERHGAVAAPSLAALLERDLDLLLVTSPSPTHADLARRAVDAGRAVLVEKPLDTDLGRAEALVRAADAAGVLLSVVSQHRFHDDVRWVKDVLDQGLLGTPVAATVLSLWKRDQAYFERPGRGRDDPAEGGVLLNQAVHAVDLLLWLLGPARAVDGRRALRTHALAVEDAAALAVALESGAVATLLASTAGHPQQAERLEIRCQRGTVVLRGGRVTELLVEPGLALPPVPGRRPSAPRADKLEPFRRQHRDVCRALRTGTPPLVTGEQALATLAFLHAACRRPVDRAGVGRDAGAPHRASPPLAPESTP